MDTKKATIRFIILIPHRDAGNHLEEYRQKLFSCGVPGAHSFPAAAPLAEVFQPFDREEFKELAQNIRRLSLEKDGKIRCSLANTIVKTGQMSFFGPALDISIAEDTFPATARRKITQILSPPVLCAALIGGRDTDKKADLTEYTQIPAIAFRAASLANLTIRPLAVEPDYSMDYSMDYSYEWMTGPPVWLPAFKKA